LPVPRYPINTIFMAVVLPACRLSKDAQVGFMKSV
jgi:hypothetical protein